jgi:hypothetical protein
MLVLLALCGSVLQAFPQSILPGELNYIDGSVLVDGKPISQTQTPVALKSGERLNSSKSRAEVLLTPGSFLRVRQGTVVTLTSVTPQSIGLGLTKGEVLVDVTQLGKERIEISLEGRIILPLAPGLYEFDADIRQLRVYAGKALIQDSQGELEVRKGYAAALDAAGIRLEQFDSKIGDALYLWSALTSEHEAAASYEIALGLRKTSSGDDWYWNGQMHCWAFVPRNGIVYGPFQWGFAAPSAISQALIMNGPAFHYPAVANPQDLPRDFTQFSNGANVDIARAPQLKPPYFPWMGSGPGIPSSPIPRY